MTAPLRLQRRYRGQVEALLREHTSGIEVLGSFHREIERSYVMLQEGGVVWTG